MTDSATFTVELHEQGTVLYIVVHGDFDAFTAPQFDAACGDAASRVKARSMAVQVDLSHATLIDSAAITSILLASRRFATFAVHAPHPWQERLFSIVGLWESLGRADEDQANQG